METIKAGSIQPALPLGIENEIGSLEPGKLVDIVVVEGNPLKEIQVLADADNVKYVYQGGKLVKDGYGI